MGLFASRPEEPFEWAGLPSEPLEPESDAERLDGAMPIDPAGLTGSAFGQVVIPVEQPAEEEPSGPGGAAPGTGADSV